MDDRHRKALDEARNLLQPVSAVVGYRPVRLDTLRALVELAGQDAEVTEYGIVMSGGGHNIRPDGIEKHYPLREWLERKTRDGMTIEKRTIIIVKDWEKVKPGD